MTVDVSVADEAGTPESYKTEITSAMFFLKNGAEVTYNGESVTAKTGTSSFF